MRKYKSDIGDLKLIIRKSKAIARNRFSKGDKMTEMTAMIGAHDQKQTQKIDQRSKGDDDSSAQPQHLGLTEECNN